MSWSTSQLRVRLAPLNRFKPSRKIFYWPFQGGTSFVDLLCFCSVLCFLCLCVRLFVCALWSPAGGGGLASWLSLVASNCGFVTFPLVSWVRCGTWLYRFLIFAPLLTFSYAYFLSLLLSLYANSGKVELIASKVPKFNNHSVSSFYCPWFSICFTIVFSRHVCCTSVRHHKELVIDEISTKLQLPFNLPIY